MAEKHSTDGLTPDKRLYLRRKAAGVCPKCGKRQPSPDCQKCELCLSRERDRYTKRKMDGRCPGCGEVTREGRVFCQICADYRDAATRKSLASRWTKGLCKSCLGAALPGRLYCEHHKQQSIDTRKRRLARGVCIYCREPAESGFVACNHHILTGRSSALRLRAQLRDEVITAYGGWSCACCGLVEPRECLEIDHINNDGNIHRKLGLTGDKLFRKLRGEGWPPGFQVLCTNCNVAKSRYGACPHVDPDSRLPTGYEASWRYHCKLRDKAFEALGGYICVCCGQTEKKFLQLDHINNDGAAQRRSGITSGIRLYKWLRENGYPQDVVQPMCANCNRAKKICGGQCPCRERI